ncbi:hypothetical protein KLA_16070 [Cellulophaga geojensis KL-A]|uniref:Uncharacterized protein n=1 Tax=Cellulophaga geojensis KL-A TaxID=1328323 RepID=A0ABP3B336_9FLAO|nr:hypothetical protein [Cellulophaga geojensis]EWH11116.1 hypothetical protein KLA_16070 [Cellulophaga geojensis KL-A]
MKMLKSDEGRKALEGLGANKVNSLLGRTDLLDTSVFQVNEMVDALINHLDNSNNFNKIFD